MSAFPGNNVVADGLALNRAAFDGVLARIAWVMQEKPTDHHPVCLICGRPLMSISDPVRGGARAYCRCGYTDALARRLL